MNRAPPIALLLCALVAVLGACTAAKPKQPISAFSAPPAPPVIYVDRSGPDEVQQVAETTVAATGRKSDQAAPLSEGSARIIRGTGRLAGATPPERPSGQDDDPNAITLNFENADVREIVRAVLGDILKQTYTIDPNVQGNVTFRTSRPVPRAALIPALEEVLRVNGFGLVEARGVYNVVPIKEATRQAPLRQPDPGRPGYGYSVQIVPLRYVGAEEMKGILGSVISAEAVLRADPARNLVVLAGTARELATALELIDIFDVDWLKGMSFAFFPVKSVDAKTLVKELGLIFAAEKSPIAGVVRLIPIERTNAVLAISPRADYLDRVALWVENFDRGTAAADTRIYVYYVQNGRAADLAAVLTKLFTPAQPDRVLLLPGTALSVPRQAPEAEPSPFLPGQAPLALSRPQGPGPALAQRGSISPERLSVPQGLAQEPQRPAQAPQPLVPPSPESDETTSTPQNAPRIIADETNNALLILATPRDYRIIEAALRKLDIPPLQVFIEAAIAEVTLTNDFRFGVQWFFQFGTSRFTLSDAASGAVNPRFPGFAYVLAGTDIRATLSALEEVTTVNVISSPKIMVLNNQPATLLVGDQVPIATQSAVGILTAGAPIVNSIQFRDTGVILKVTPRVNDGGRVQLDISQEVSEVRNTTTSTIDSPTIQQRKLSSTVGVQNGETIALGGLIRDSRRERDSGLPFLKRIPVLGYAFKTNEDTETRTELLVLLTPRVVRSAGEMRAVTDELRTRMKPIIPPGTLPASADRK